MTNPTIDNPSNPSQQQQKAATRKLARTNRKKNEEEKDFKPEPDSQGQCLAFTDEPDESQNQCLAFTDEEEAAESMRSLEGDGIMFKAT